MNSVGRAIQRATWTTGGAVGPGGSPFRMRRRYPAAMFLLVRGGPLAHGALWTAPGDGPAVLLGGEDGVPGRGGTGTVALVGAAAEKGKLTVFGGEGPRETGAPGTGGVRVHHGTLAGNMSAPGGLELQELL